MKYLILVLGIIIPNVVHGQDKHENLGNSLFAADVYKELLNNQSGNFAVSPLSVQITLALVHDGAGGKTAEEIASALHISNDKAEVQKAMKELTPLLNGGNKYTLNCANKIYVQKPFKIHKKFKKTAINVFKSDIANIDFRNTEEAATKINKWVAKQTKDKIKKLVNPDDLDSTVTLLVNAMYFHGKWVYKFPNELTSVQPFYPYTDKIQKVPTMNLLARFKYYECNELNAQFLEIPYEGNDVTMTIVLPFEKDGLSALEQNIPKVLSVHHYSYEKVNLAIPKFKIESTIKFNSILRALGISEAFKNSADLKEILEDQNLAIGEVIQKTFIEVDEKGTTAASATGINILLKHRPVVELETQFIADHPFIYFLKIKDSIFFVGRYTGE